MTSMDWQLADDAAVQYETVLVPAILGPFAKALVDWADWQPDRVIVDIGCGTGVATRYVASYVGTAGRLIGVDVNPGMLNVARSLPVLRDRPVEWQQESVYALSLADSSVDVILCAQMLQFLSDRPQALRELRRILKAGGALYISLWCDIQQNPYFDAVVEQIARHIGTETAAGLGAAFQLTDLAAIQSLLQDAGLTIADTTVATLELALPPVATFVPRHIHATPMGPGYQAASDHTQQRVLASLADQLSAYVMESGIKVPFRSHLIKATA